MFCISHFRGMMFTSMPVVSPLNVTQRHNDIPIKVRVGDDRRLDAGACELQASALLIRMDPLVRHDLPRSRQLDHPHRRRRATLSTRSAPQRGLSPRPADGSSRRLARVLQRLHSTSSQPRPPLRHCPIMGDGWAGPFIPFFFRRRFGEILEKLRWKNTAPV